MTAQGHDHAWLDSPALRTASDILLGGILAVAGITAIANVEGNPFSRFDRIDPWLYPAAVGGLLLAVAAVLLVRGALIGSGPPVRWNPVALAMVLSAVAVASLAWGQWGMRFALLFGPPEFASLTVLQLAIAISIARRSLVRTTGMVLLGLLLATVGTDLSSGTERLTMGLAQLQDGIALPIVVLGLIVVADGVVCLLSPTLFLETYTRALTRWNTLRIPAIAGLGMRALAALAIAAAGIATFQINSAPWDVGWLVAFAVFGVACKVLGWNRLVLVLALTGGQMLEENIGRSMLISRGNPEIFLRPLSAGMLLAACTLLAVAMLLWARPALLQRRSAA